uniref:Uncharacterized protein n=1 Tax=Sphaerodactylus townsendi TaxID=933632 RepID=A0ACB8F057_9SAUR
MTLEQFLQANPAQVHTSVAFGQPSDLKEAASLLEVFMATEHQDLKKQKDQGPQVCRLMECYAKWEEAVRAGTLARKPPHSDCSSTGGTCQPGHKRPLNPLAPRKPLGRKGEPTGGGVVFGELVESEGETKVGIKAHQTWMAGQDRWLAPRTTGEDQKPMVKGPVKAKLLSEGRPNNHNRREGGADLGLRMLITVSFGMS